MTAYIPLVVQLPIYHSLVSGLNISVHTSCQEEKRRKIMPSSRHKLLFIKRMRLIGVALYEPDLDRLESIWSQVSLEK